MQFLTKKVMIDRPAEQPTDGHKGFVWKKNFQ